MWQSTSWLVCMEKGKLSPLASEMKRSGHQLEASKDNPWSRPCQLKLNPADPEFSGDGTLFRNNSLTGKWCVACSINTWEQSRAKNPKKSYLLSKRTQELATSFLWCKKCGHFVCNICAHLFSKKLQSLTKQAHVTPSWCKIVDSLLLKARNTSGITMEIPSNVCFACQHKHDFLNVVTPLATTAGIIQDTSDAPLAVGSMLSKARRNSQKKRRKLCDKYKKKRNHPSHSLLDGALLFPEIGIVIQSDLHHFDSLSIAKQVGIKKEQVEQGLLHMNITPRNAIVLEQERCFPMENSTSIELLHADCKMSYPSPEDPSNITIK